MTPDYIIFTDASCVGRSKHSTAASFRILNNHNATASGNTFAVESPDITHAETAAMAYGLEHLRKVVQKNKQSHKTVLGITDNSYVVYLIRQVIPRWRDHKAIPDKCWARIHQDLPMHTMLSKALSSKYIDVIVVEINGHLKPKQSDQVIDMLGNFGYTVTDSVAKDIIHHNGIVDESARNYARELNEVRMANDEGGI